MSDFYTLRSKLVDILSSGNIVTDQDACKLYSQDVYSISDHTVRAVIKPDNITELSKAIKEITSAEYAIIPRGGGMSYTGGYLPTNDKAIALDIGRDIFCREKRDDFFYKHAPQMPKQENKKFIFRLFFF